MALGLDDVAQGRQGLVQLGAELLQRPGADGLLEEILGEVGVGRHGGLALELDLAVGIGGGIAAVRPGSRRGRGGLGAGLGPRGRALPSAPTRRPRRLLGGGQIPQLADDFRQALLNPVDLPLAAGTVNDAAAPGGAPEAGRTYYCVEIRTRCFLCLVFRGVE